MNTVRTCPTCRASGRSLLPLPIGAVTLCGTCSSPMIIVANNDGARQLTEDEVKLHSPIIERKRETLLFLLRLARAMGR